MALFPRSLEIGFHPFTLGLSASVPPPACSINLVGDINHLEQIHRSATGLVTGMRHLPYEERLQRRQLRADLMTTRKIFTGLLDIDPELFFLPPARRGLGGHPYKVLQGASRRRRRGSAFSVRAVKANRCGHAFQELNDLSSTCVCM